MKKQNTIQRALILRKTSSSRKKQRGFAMEWIIIVLLITAALVPLIMWLGHIAQEKGWTIGRILNGKGGQAGMQQAADDYVDSQDQLDEEGKKANKTTGKLNSSGGASFGESDE